MTVVTEGLNYFLLHRIFVPTNRSTLLDILLGKASPLKKPRRSASASPSRAKSTDNEVSTKPALRRSPRKQSQKTIDVVAEEQPLALTGIIFDTAYIDCN